MAGLLKEQMGPALNHAVSLCAALHLKMTMMQLLLAVVAIFCDSTVCVVRLLAPQTQDCFCLARWCLASLFVWMHTSLACRLLFGALLPREPSVMGFAQHWGQAALALIVYLCGSQLLLGSRRSSSMLCSRMLRMAKEQLEKTSSLKLFLASGSICVSGTASIILFSSDSQLATWGAVFKLPALLPLAMLARELAFRRWFPRPTCVVSYPAIHSCSSQRGRPCLWHGRCAICLDSLCVSSDERAASSLVAGQRLQGLAVCRQLPQAASASIAAARCNLQGVYTVVTLKCGHRFHARCWDLAGEHLAGEQCPLCRAQRDSGEQAVEVSDWEFLHVLLGMCLTMCVEIASVAWHLAA
ncbi:unnamed protein product, partial [Polarella glacialis]